LPAVKNSEKLYFRFGLACIRKMRMVKNPELVYGRDFQL